MLVNPALPPVLYHGSRFKQNELQPGFNHTKKIVTWDKTESNAFLYATSVRNTAIELGFASSLEKIFNITYFRVQDGEIIIECDVPFTLKDLAIVPVFLYKIDCKDADGWVKNNNEHNGLTTEYKTQKTVRSILLTEKIDVCQWLSSYKVNVRRTKHSPVVGLENYRPLANAFRFTW